jgi:hypothetical protein
MRALGHEHDQLYNTKALDMLPMCLSVGARQFQPEAAHLWFKLAHGDIAAAEAEPWLARLWLCNGDKCRGARKGPAVAAHGPHPGRIGAGHRRPIGFSGPAGPGAVH